MLTARERQALLADMSEAEMQLNTTLQIIGHGAKQGIYGKGHRRRPRIDTIELLEQLALE